MLYISGKITTVPRLFSEYLSEMKNKHQIMNVDTKWNCLIPILSNLVKYYLFHAGLKMLVNCKGPLHVSDKITTVPRIFSECLPQMVNKHQITNLHTKWNCLIPILSNLVKYYSF